MAIDHKRLKFPPQLPLERCVVNELGGPPAEAVFKYDRKNDRLYLSVDRFLELKKTEILTTLIKNLSELFAGTTTSERLLSRKIENLTAETIDRKTEDLKKILPDETKALTSESTRIAARLLNAFKLCTDPIPLAKSTSFKLESPR